MFRIITPYATCFFRNDLNWSRFCKLIFDNFKKSTKVDITCIGCSDGTEPISLLLKLQEFRTFRKNVSKYMPIKAFDNDETQINIAKSNKIPLINNLCDNIFDTVSIYKNTVFRFLRKDYVINNETLSLNKNLQDYIEYELKDIRDVLKDINKDKDNVILTRNIFPYLHNYEIYDVLQQLSKLKKGSILAIGDYDIRNLPGLENYILKLGFKNTKVKNCYIKD